MFTLRQSDDTSLPVVLTLPPTVHHRWPELPAKHQSVAPSPKCSWLRGSRDGMIAPALSPDRVTLPIGPVLDAGKSVQVGADGMNATKGGLGDGRDGWGPVNERQGIDAPGPQQAIAREPDRTGRLSLRRIAARVLRSAPLPCPVPLAGYSKEEATV